MQKQIALVQISNPSDMKIPPLPLLYIGNSLKQNNYDIKIYHFSTKNIKKYVKIISSSNPLFIGLSVITGLQTKYSAIFSKEIKKVNPEIPIIWGGVHPSILPEQCINEKYIDYVVIGEGEKTIVELTKAIEDKTDLSKIKSIAYKDKDKIKINPKRKLMEDLDKHKLDFNLINIEKYLDQHWGEKRILGFITSRGCVYNCSFCYNKTFNEGRWRSHSAEHVIKQIKELKEKYNLDGIRFYDDFLFANPERALKIIKNIDLAWYAELRINIVTEELVDQIIKTNCRELLFGLESGSDRILKLLNKQITTEQIEKGVKLLAKAENTRITGSCIIGLPTETQEECFNTIDFILKLWKINPRMRFTVGFYLPYPGSELYKKAVEMGFEVPERTEDWSKLDRWSNKLKLNWVDWQKDSTYFMNIRDYINLLPLQETNIPIIKNIPYKRLKNKQFNRKFEIKILSLLQKQFAHKGTPINKIVTKILPYVKK